MPVKLITEIIEFEGYKIKYRSDGRFTVPKNFPDDVHKRFTTWIANK